MMNFSSLSAADRNTLIAGAIIAISALISFVDPSGSWGAIMIISLLAGLAAVYVALQPQVAPTMKLPAPKGLTLLVLGVAATGASLIVVLSYLGYVLGHLTDIYELIVIVGLVASIYLLWIGWVAYQHEGGGRASAPPPPSAPPPGPSAPPPAPPAPPAEG